MLPSTIRCGISHASTSFLHAIPFSQELTGIDGLLADPHHDGGGLHQVPTTQAEPYFSVAHTPVSFTSSFTTSLSLNLHQTLSGGQLRLHTDFNFNMRNRLWRRVNVFLYLNEEDGWREPVPGGPAAEVRRGGKTTLTLSVPPHLFWVTSTAARAIPTTDLRRARGRPLRARHQHRHHHTQRVDGAPLHRGRPGAVARGALPAQVAE